MKLELFDYKLPKALIAQKPAVPRDSSKLLVYSKSTDKIVHDRYCNLDKYLTKNDVLVFNDSKVFPARLIGKKETGGKAEILLLEQVAGGKWEVLIGTKRPRIGLKLQFKKGLEATVVKVQKEKTWLVEFNCMGSRFFDILDCIGEVPLPPYIGKDEIKGLKSKVKIKRAYQTVYAKERGSAAAPTAGLHFTNRLIGKIKKKGVQIEYVTLHVGLGTFNPVNTENIEDYKIHSELVSVNKSTLQSLQKAKKEGKRIISVGTTSTRTLEAIFSKKKEWKDGFSDYVDIYIYPGYEFKFIDGMITNFHLPKSSLIMLVSALIGRKKTLDIYNLAIKLKYRFFSFGDGMMLTD
jgi:S-adenosylmethionine:tRNA ribosyltransferase-isomerase